MEGRSEHYNYTHRDRCRYYGFDHVFVECDDELICDNCGISKCEADFNDGCVRINGDYGFNLWREDNPSQQNAIKILEEYPNT